VFAFIDQRTVSAQFRLNYSFTPNLTVQGYAEPFASSGQFYGFGELAKPRTSDLRTYGVAAGTGISGGTNGNYTIRDGAQTFSLVAPDFQVLSFRSNLVVRWEWLAGSTFFLIWQQNRGDQLLSDADVRVGSLWDAVRAPGDNFFAVKLSYWLKVR
jgi:hypothetical protein